MTGRRTRLVIRAPNHLGDLVMAMPALVAARPDAVVVARPLAQLIPFSGFEGEVIPIDRGGRGMPPAARAIRRGRFGRGILLTPSFSSALLFRLGSVRSVRGSLTDRRAALLTDGIARAEIDAHHRSMAYWLLAMGALPDSAPVPVLRPDDSQQARWREMAGPADGPVAGVFPGGNASSRRWPSARFARVVRTLVEDGLRVVVFGGPSERELTRVVAAGGALDCGGRTDLALLAAALGACDILLTNDSGPMHLAAAVGTPTVSLWGAGNPAVTGVAGDAHVRIRRADLPCVPCVKNECPRHGAGYILPDAERECLALIEPEEVTNAVRRALGP